MASWAGITMDGAAIFKDVVVVALLIVVGTLGPACGASGKLESSSCPTGFANFGDSLTDTGNALYAFPYTYRAEFSPYGSTFFGEPAKRFSNGRVVPDFFSLAFRKPLLDAYFATTSFNYEFGINLAVAGTTAAPSGIPFELNPSQVNNFIRFKRSAANTTLEGRRACGDFIRNLPDVRDPYGGWLYTILSGGNDLLNEVLADTPLATIADTTIPAALGNITAAIQSLYAVSARKFLIFNLPAQGCVTAILTRLQNSSLPKDSMGCIVAINEIVSEFNAGLNRSMKGLREALPDASFALFDTFRIHREILRKPTAYGLNSDVKFVACCGGPGLGSLNYNPGIRCGDANIRANVCSNPDEYVSWDGVHFTEQFYRAIATFALRGEFTDDPVNYTALCGLDFSKFGPGVTLQQAYPSKCISFFG